MNREQAINYLISRGFTHEQVGEVVRALTYKPRDCANCKHYVVTDTRTNWGSQETTKIYGCECWECEYEPTTKNNLGVDREDAVERLNALKQLIGYDKDSEIVKATQKSLDMAIKALEQEPTTKNNLGVEEVTALAEWTERLTKASEDAYNKGYADGMKAQEPRKGYWLRRPHVYGVTYCSVCDFELKIDNTNYCPNCGAKMEDV